MGALREQALLAGTAQAPPLYSMPHLSFTTTCLPVSSLMKGFGLTGTVCRKEPVHRSGAIQVRCSISDSSEKHTRVVQTSPLPWWSFVLR